MSDSYYKHHVFICTNVRDDGRACCAERGAQLFEMPIWMWQWSVEDDRRVPWHRAFSIRLGAEALARKQAAIACHRSQLETNAGSPVAAPGGVFAPWLQQEEVLFG